MKKGDYKSAYQHVESVSYGVSVCLCDILDYTNINIISRSALLYWAAFSRVQLQHGILTGTQTNNKLGSVQKELSRLGGNGSNSGKQLKKLKLERIKITGKLIRA